jgi:hypothetical protein
LSLRGPPIVIGWPTKKHKVVYVLVIGLHQSHWVTPHSHCVARLSHWAAHHSHGVARPSYWGARLGHLPLWLLWQFPMLHSGQVAILDVTFRVSGNSGCYIPGSGNSGCYIPGKWQFPMLHSGLWQFGMLHSGLWQFPMLHSGLWQFGMLHSGLWQFPMLHVAILDVTMSAGVIMPRGPFVSPVLGQRQVLGKLYKMENPTM